MEKKYINVGGSNERERERERVKIVNEPNIQLKHVDNLLLPMMFRK